jgi:restriction system protein
VGRILFRGAEFKAILSEEIGFKTGLAVTEERLRAVVEEIDPSLWPPSDDLEASIRTEVYAEMFAQVLHHLGAGPPEIMINPGWAVEQRNQDDPARKAAFHALEPWMNELENDALNSAFGNTLWEFDPDPFLAAAEADQGKFGRDIASQFVEALNLVLHQSPFHGVRHVAWGDIRDLDELFQSERLESPHGEFFDQRFVDFLGANFDDIDEINWRQFEGLAAEFFNRSGYAVELGPGRNDDGVDIRLWPSDVEPGGSKPAVTLVQCKRELRKITKSVVKALWADVIHENAESGLIVTSSSFSPGAERTRTARGYPISEANRESLREWIHAMKTPGTGVFLGE